MMSDDTLRDSQRTLLGVAPPSAPKNGDDMIGKLVVGRYVVETKLGSGAFGTVYRGRHTKLNRPVAIKVLHRHLVHEPTILARFRREAMLAARLAHANVIGVLEAGELPDGRQLMVLELADGQPLTALLGEPLPPDRVIRLVRQILLGLEHAHESGLVHRDLKPDNIIVELRPDGAEVPRLVDFGIAVLREPEDTLGARLTATGQIIGTPLYMAPEQARLEQIDHRIDLFALGVIVYQMLSGATPFSGAAVDVAIANMTRDPPPIAQRTGAVVDPILEQFTRKLMARALEDRFASARAALQALDVIEHDPSSAGPLLGKMDLDKAAAIVALPGLPPAKKR